MEGANGKGGSMIEKAATDIYTFENLRPRPGGLRRGVQVVLRDQCVIREKTS